MSQENVEAVRAVIKKLAIIASLLLVTAVAVCAEVTQASRKATRSERAAILHELRITRDDPLPYPKGSYRYVVRVTSTSMGGHRANGPAPAP